MAARARRENAGVLLREGELLSIDGRIASVKRVDMVNQVVDLHWAGDAKPTTVTLDSVVFAVDVRPAGVVAPPAPKLHLVKDNSVLLRTAERLAHALEAATGYQSGDPATALPHEPRPQYDPAFVRYHDRMRAKADELAADPTARRLGVVLGPSRLRQIAQAWLRGDEEAALDRRHVRTRGKRTTVTAAVETEMMKVHEEIRVGSNVSMRTRVALIRARLAANAKTRDAIPSASTIKRWHYERFSKSELGGKSRTRQSATKAPEAGWFRNDPTYPGEIVVGDSNSLDALLKGTSFEGRVNGTLVVMIDWYSRSILSLRVVETAEKSIDVSRCILDATRPKAMRAEWPDNLRWAYAVPETLLMLPPGTQAAGLPYAAVASWVFDHGATYKARDPLGVAKRLGSDILPARKGTPADKAVVERFFGSMNTMLLQWLEGHRGSDVSERGHRIDEKVTYTAQEFENILIEWAITEYQNHIMEGVRPPWTPDGEWSPNRLYSEALKRTGIAQPIPTSDDYYRSFKPRYAAIKGRGVKIGPLWYDNRQADDEDDTDVLAPFRDVPNPYGSGKELNRHEFRKDPYDNRSVYWRHPAKGRWYRLDWVAGPRETLPVFGDADVALLNREISQGHHRQLTQEQILELLVQDVLRLGDAAPGTRAARVVSRRARAAQAESQSRRDYGQDTPPETADDERKRADAAVDAARATRRRRAVKAVASAPPPQATEQNTAEPVPAAPAPAEPVPAQAVPDLRVVPPPVEQPPAAPVPPASGERVVPVPARPLGATRKGLFPRRAPAPVTSTEKEDPQR